MCIYKCVSQRYTGRNDVCTKLFTVVLFVMAKDWKLSKCPSLSDCFRKQWYIHIMKSYVIVNKCSMKCYGMCTVCYSLCKKGGL